MRSRKAVRCASSWVCVKSSSNWSATTIRGPGRPPGNALQLGEGGGAGAQVGQAVSGRACLQGGHQSGQGEGGLATAGGAQDGQGRGARSGALQAGDQGLAPEEELPVLQAEGVEAPEGAAGGRRRVDRYRGRGRGRRGRWLRGRASPPAARPGARHGRPAEDVLGDRGSISRRGSRARRSGVPRRMAPAAPTSGSSTGARSGRRASRRSPNSISAGVRARSSVSLNSGRRPRRLGGRGWWRRGARRPAVASTRARSTSPCASGARRRPRQARRLLDRHGIGHRQHGRHAQVRTRR